VAFHFDEKLVVAGPVANRKCHRGCEHFLNLRGISLWDFLQQLDRLFTSQVYFHALCRTDCVLAVGVVDRQRTDFANLFLPVIRLCLQRGRVCVGFQTLAPTLERARRGRQG